MASCTSTPFSFNVQYFYDSSCFTCDDECGSSTMNARCVAYTGANLSCSGIETNDSLETAIQKIDEQICSITGDYSGYSFNCLLDWWEESITSESEFVDAITSYACEITENLQAFTGVEFPAYQSSVSARFDSIEGPSITCSFAGVTSSDPLDVILEKYCTAFGELDSSLSLAGVDWDQCFIVTTPPTTIAEAFSLVIDQICQVESAGASLPTFNNTANCIGGSSEDSLETTINGIIGILCETQPFDGSGISFGCLDPGGDSLQEVIESLVDSASDYTENRITFSEDFVVSALNEEDPCTGRLVTLATPINQDRLVAVDVSDTSPGTLSDKLVAGSGITLTNSGTQIEISSDGTEDSFQVKVVEEGDEGYLLEKIVGQSITGIGIDVGYNSETDQIEITPIVNLSELFALLLEELDGDAELKALFCEKMVSCPSPCDAPTDVQAVPVNTTSTTTILL